jgi:CRISPR system Cascade subunit CasE
MYLSRLVLNPRSRRVQREVTDLYQLHRSLMRGFPDHLAPGDERVLFRLEGASWRGGLILLVQSQFEPDWSWLEEPDANGYLQAVDVPNPAVKPVSLSLVLGQTLAFRLRANPTARRRLPDGSRKRVGLRREEEQMAWLMRKAQQHGFKVVSVRTSDRCTVNGWIRRNGKRHPLTLLSVRFDGVLRVSHPDRVIEAVRFGIGSGKGLGFGLLSLAPPPG